MFCTKCGAPLPDGASFCTKCGNRIDADVAGGSAFALDATAGKTAADARPQAGMAADAPAASVAAERTPDAGHAAAGAAPARSSSAAAVANPAPAVAAPAAAAARNRTPFVVAAAVVVVAAIAAVAAWFLFFSPYTIDESTFPDAGVRAAVAQQADADGDGKLSRDEAKAVTALSIEGAAEVSDLGKLMPNIEQLSVSGDSLSSVDVSGMGALAGLSVSGPAVSSVNASNAGALTSLTVSSPNASPSVDVTGSGALANLSVPSGSAVSGADSAGLREAWLPVQVSMIDGGEETWRTCIERSATGAVTAIREGSVLNGAFGGQGSRYVRNYEYAYDEAGLLSGYVFYYGEEGERDGAEDREIVRGASGEVLAVEGPGSETEYSYDDAGNLVGRGAMRYVRDDGGNVTSCRNLARGGSGTTMLTWEYDGEGRVVGYTSPFGTGGTARCVGAISYDDAGRPVAVGKGSGAGDDDYLTEAQYSYDDQGLLVGAEGKSGYADSKERSSLSAEVAYDERGNVASITSAVGSGGGLARETSFSLDYARFFLPSDAEWVPDVVVQPDFGVAGATTLIQPYVIRPEIVRVSSDLPLALDDQYYQANRHLSI